MIMEDLFIKYPSLKPATDQEIIEVKKSFMEFLDMNHMKQREVTNNNIISFLFYFGKIAYSSH